MTPNRHSFVQAVLITATIAIAAATSNPVTLPAQTAAPSAAAKAGDEILPDLAVDPTVVAQQQEVFKAACDEDAATQVSIDCPCMVERYPEFRLKRLSAAIRSTKMERDSKCQANPPAADCKQVQDRFAKLTSREGQIEFNPIASGPPGRKRPPNTSTFYVEYLAQCKNSAALAQQIENDCLAGPPPAGKSAKDFCSCVAGHYRKGFEAAPGRFSSDLDVSLKTEAYVACRK